MPEQVLAEDTVRQLSRDEPDWMREHRIHAYEAFRDMEKPKFKYGLSLYMPIRGAKLEEIKPLESDEEVNVEVEGDAEVLGVREALEDEEYSDLIKEYWMKKAYYPGENKVTAMHGAFWTKGLLIYLPKGTQSRVEIDTRMKKDTSISHVILIAEPNSHAHVVERTTSDDLDYGLKSQGVEAFLMEGAHVIYESLQTLGEKVWHFNTKRAVLGKEAQMDWFTGTFGARHSKVEVSADLGGEGANTNNLGVFMGTGFQEFDTYNTAVHSAPHTDSDMDNKGIVTDRAQSVYRGLVKIKENARNCSGYQKEDTLILSDTAEADAVPNLEIENNEVMCSHGATVGQVDEEKLFYMMTRGLSEKEAQREIVKGFLGAMISRVESDNLREEMEDLVLERMS